jgi:hypothetical protein
VNGRASTLLRDEHGQSIVLFVITTVALMGLLALVLNVGHWLQSQRQLQTVADATALDAAQLDHDTFAEVSVEAPNAAGIMAQENWAGTALTGYDYDGESTGFALRGPNKAWLKFRIQVEHEVGFLAQNMLSFLGVDLTSPLLFRSDAEVTIDSPIGIAQVAPIAVRCGSLPNVPSCESPWPGWDASLSASQREWPLDPEDTSPSSPDARSFVYEPEPGPDHADDTFMPIEAFPGATVFNVEDMLASCDPRQPTSPCGMNVPDTPTGLPPLDPAPGLSAAEKADALRAALQNAGDWPHLVAVYDNNPDTDGDINVIGFAAFWIRNVDDGPGGPVTITGTFHKMFFHAADTPGGGDYDFGVRTIALSGGGPVFPPP